MIHAMRGLLIIPLLLVIALASPEGDWPSSWAYQLQNAVPEQVAQSGYDIVVMDYSYDGTEEGEYGPEDIQLIVDHGVTPVAYVSIGEAEDYRFYWNESWYEDPPDWLGSGNPDWPGNYAVKYWKPQWQDIILSYLDRILDQGFKGAYLDRIDAFEHWSDPYNGEDTVLEEGDAASRMISFILNITEHCRSMDPDFLIIPQNGERILLFDDASLREAVSGWAVEDMFYDGTQPVDPSETQERLDILQPIISEKFVLSVDYVDDGSGLQGENLERITDYVHKALGAGLIPYPAMSDRELDELIPKFFLPEFPLD